MVLSNCPFFLLWLSVSQFLSRATNTIVTTIGCIYLSTRLYKGRPVEEFQSFIVDMNCIVNWTLFLSYHVLFIIKYLLDETYFQKLSQILEVTHYTLLTTSLRISFYQDLTCALAFVNFIKHSPALYVYYKRKRIKNHTNEPIIY